MPDAGQPEPAGKGDAAAALWNLVLADLRETMTEQTYACWFAQTAAVCLGADELVVQAPSPLHQRSLDTRLRARIEATLGRVGYPHLRLLFVLP
jgi:chromosomal replication initiation ATPase DnaA